MKKIHKNDLDLESLDTGIEDKVNVYYVETFNNNLINNNHDTYCVYVASTFEKAYNWCKSVPDYGGFEDTWHWRITRIPLDYDTTDHVHVDQEWWDLTRNMEPCTTNGAASLEEADQVESINETLADLQDTLYDLRIEFMTRIDEIRETISNNLNTQE